MFNTLHLMFMTQYTESWNALDSIAERIRALGHYAPGTYREYAKLSSIAEPESVPEALEMVRLLVNANESVAKTARAAFEKTVAMINDFKEYFLRHGQTVYENPSPGNKAGVISTLEEKSLGCTQKAGTSPVMDVLAYGDRVTHAGVNLLAGPGNDIVAQTVLAAAGAHLILFTTGRGTPLGSPVPTVKIATNSTLAARKPHWIDVNAGVLLEGTGMNEAAHQLFDTVLEVASGQPAKNELNGFREIAIFKDGVTL